MMCKSSQSQVQVKSKSAWLCITQQAQIPTALVLDFDKLDCPPSDAWLNSIMWQIYFQSNLNLFSAGSSVQTLIQGRIIWQLPLAGRRAWNNHVLENRHPLIRNMVTVQIWLGYKPFISLISLNYHSFIGYKWNISQIQLKCKGVSILY